jgi:hypothetical protein
LPRQTQLAVGPLVAALGAVLLIVSLFLDWYETYTGFTVFEFLDLLLLLLGLATIAALAGGLGLMRPAVPPALSLGLAVLTAFVVLSQILNDPPLVIGPGPDKDIGIWLALSGSALMVAGAVLGYAHISLALETRPREGGAAPGGSAPGGPAPGGSAHAGPAGPGQAGRPGVSHDDPTRPLTDPAASRRADEPPRS